MKLATYVLGETSGIAIYPLISLFLFFTIFAIMVVLVLRASKQRMQEYARLPLDDQVDTDIVNEQNKKNT